MYRLKSLEIVIILNYMYVELNWLVVLLILGMRTVTISNIDLDASD